MVIFKEEQRHLGLNFLSATQELRRDSIIYQCQKKKKKRERELCRYTRIQKDKKDKKGVFHWRQLLGKGF